MKDLNFISRRPVVVVPNAAVASGQPQAAQIGVGECSLNAPDNCNTNLNWIVVKTYA